MVEHSTSPTHNVAGGGGGVGFSVRRAPVFSRPVEQLHRPDFRRGVERPRVPRAPVPAEKLERLEVRVPRRGRASPSVPRAALLEQEAEHVHVASSGCGPAEEDRITRANEGIIVCEKMRAGQTNQTGCATSPRLRLHTCVDLDRQRICATHTHTHTHTHKTFRLVCAITCIFILNTYVSQPNKQKRELRLT